MDRINYNIEANFFCYPYHIGAQHWEAAKSCEWGVRWVVHIVTGFVEFIPLLGAVVALFEMTILKSEPPKPFQIFPVPFIPLKGETPPLTPKKEKESPVSTNGHFVFEPETTGTAQE